MHDVNVSGVAHANNGAMLAALAVAGVGVTLEPDFIVAPDVRAGRLVRLRGEANGRTGVDADPESSRRGVP